jgi:hypothetical protein
VIELDLAPKRAFVPHDFLYKFTNLKNLFMSESICFKGPNRAMQFSSQTWKVFLQFFSTISTFVNSISS